MNPVTIFSIPGSPFLASVLFAMKERGTVGAPFWQAILSHSPTFTWHLSCIILH